MANKTINDFSVTELGASDHLLFQQGATPAGTTAKAVGSQVLNSQALTNYTNVESGFALSQGTPTSTFTVGAGVGYIVDNYTDPANPTQTKVTYAGAANQTVTLLASTVVTFLYMDSSATLYQSPFPPGSTALDANTDRRDRMYLGLIFHLDGATVTVPDDGSKGWGVPAGLTLMDLTDTLGIVNRSGNNITANGANLKFDKSAGVYYFNPANGGTDRKNPNFVAGPAISPASFLYTWWDGVSGWNFSASTSDLVPGKYDDLSGTLANVEAYQWTLHRIFNTPAGGNLVVVQYDQSVYESKSAAIAAAHTAVVTSNPSTINMPQRAIIALKGDATDITDERQAVIISGDKFNLRNLMSAPILDGVSNLAQFNSGGQVSPTSLTVASDGVTITASLERNGGGDVVFQVGDESFLLDTTPAATSTLTAGTDTVPQTNYIYATESGGVISLNTSTSGFPTSGWFSAIGKVIVQSAATVQTDGALSIQKWTDHASNEDWTRGHLVEINERFRQQFAEWASGAAPTATVSGTNVWFSTTSGAIYQLHRQSWASTDSDTGGGNDLIYVVNDNTTPYTQVNSINFSTDANGGSLNNNSFSVVLWGAVSSGGVGGKVYANVPNAGYTGGSRDADATSDINNEAVYNIPAEFKSTAFLLARVVINNSGGTPTIVDTIDLRGAFPGAFGASGTSTTAGNTFNDTLFRVFDDADNTKDIAFEASTITTGTTRTLTVQDQDGVVSVQGPATLTQGSIPFADATGKLAQDNAELFWDDTNNRLGIGTSTPSASLDIDNGALILSGQTTNASSIEMGAGRTGNGFAIFDMVGDTTYPDYGFRILRGNAGANSDTSFFHRGTGQFLFFAQDAGRVVFGTSNLERLGVESNGDINLNDNKITNVVSNINTQTGTTYTLALTDGNSIVEMNNAGANTVTIPTNASVAFPIGTTITVMQYGAGLTTVEGDTGVTVNGVSGGSKATTAQYQGLAVYKRGTNEWIILNK